MLASKPSTDLTEFDLLSGSTSPKPLTAAKDRSLVFAVPCPDMDGVFCAEYMTLHTDDAAVEQLRRVLKPSVAK